MQQPAHLPHDQAVVHQFGQKQLIRTRSARNQESFGVLLPSEEQESVPDHHRLPTS